MSVDWILLGVCDPWLSSMRVFQTEDRSVRYSETFSCILDIGVDLARIQIGAVSSIPSIEACSSSVTASLHSDGTLSLC